MPIVAMSTPNNAAVATNDAVALIAEHNESDAAHADIRALLVSITNRLDDLDGGVYVPAPPSDETE